MAGSSSSSRCWERYRRSRASSTSVEGPRPSIPWRRSTPRSRSRNDRRQPLAPRLVGAQAGEQVLLGRPHPLAAHLLRGLGLAARDGADVREQPEDLLLALQPGGIVGRPVPPRGRRRARSAASPPGRGRSRGGTARIAAKASPARVSAGPKARSTGRPGIGLLLADDGLELQQRIAGVDLHVRGDQHRPDPPGEGGRHGRLHLHALQHDERVADRHPVAGRHRHRHDHRRRRRADDAALVAGDGVGDALDLDGVDGPDEGGQHPVPAARQGDPPLDVAEPLDVDVDQRRPGRHPIGRRAELVDAQVVRVAPVAELDAPADLGGRAGPPARDARRRTTSGRARARRRRPRRPR